MSDSYEKKSGVGPKTPTFVTRPYSTQWVGSGHETREKVVQQGRPPTPEVTWYSEKIKAVALAVIKLHLSEGIRALVK